MRAIVKISEVQSILQRHRYNISFLLHGLWAHLLILAVNRILTKIKDILAHTTSGCQSIQRLPVTQFLIVISFLIRFVALLLIVKEPLVVEWVNLL
jgi:hypothetical protein